MRRSISLVIFDGDDTLWHGLDGGFISGKTYQHEGEDGFTFIRKDGAQITRNDGQRFVLYPEVRQVLDWLKEIQVAVSLATYNRTPPVLSALAAFGLTDYFQHIKIAWSSCKDLMIQEIIQEFRQDGISVDNASTLFIDDDRYGHYRNQMEKIGVAFLQKGVDILSLEDIQTHPAYSLIKPDNLF